MAKQERVNLTMGRINAFSCPNDKQQAFLWDSEVPGLAVRATAPGKRTPKGTRAFIFQSYLEGATPRITIGDTKAWSIDDARKEARRLQTQIDQGIDPREKKREREKARVAADLDQKKKEERKKHSMAALCEAYCELLETRGKGKTARQARSILKCHVLEATPETASLPACEVTSHQVAAMIRQVNEQGKERTAGILRSYLSAAFNAARRSPFDAKLPSHLIAFDVQSNPVEPISTIAVKRGERVLNAAELKNYITMLGDSLTDKALKLALLSGGQRMAQLLRAKVSDYNLQTKTLRLLDGKGKRLSAREHFLPLAPKAAAIVEDLIARASTVNTPHLFSSFGKTQLTETTPGKRVAGLCTVMGTPAFNLRDIRRTCETMLAELGINRDIRAQLLSHGLSGVQNAHYDRYSYADEKRNALIIWENRLSELERP